MTEGNKQENLEPDQHRGYVLEVDEELLADIVGFGIFLVLSTVLLHFIH